MGSTQGAGGGEGTCELGRRLCDGLGTHGGGKTQ